jgi:hypothetical protein
MSRLGVPDKETSGSSVKDKIEEHAAVDDHPILL